MTIGRKFLCSEFQLDQLSYGEDFKMDILREERDFYHVPAFSRVVIPLKSFGVGTGCPFHGKSTLYLRLLSTLFFKYSLNASY